MRLLYLKGGSSRASTNAGLWGRSLVRHLRKESPFSDVLVRHVVLPGAQHEVPDDLRNDVLSEDELEEYSPDAIYFEGGLFNGDWRRPEPRVPLTRLETRVRDGAVVWISDVNANEAQQFGRAYDDVAGFTHATPATDGNGGLIYGDDPISHLGSTRRVLAFPDRMFISDWLTQVYDSVERIELLGPVMLATDADILASGNGDTSRILVADIFVDDPYPFPVATVTSRGHGYVVVCGAGVSPDAVVDSTPDNARWITRTLTLLTDRAKENREIHGVGKASAASPHPTRSLLEMLKAVSHGAEDQWLEAKESAQYDIATKQKSKERLDDVIRTVAAFANTEGGTLLIGVEDNTGEVKGLRRDYSLLGKQQDWDTFQNALNQKVVARLGIHAAAYVRLTREVMDDEEIAVVFVRPSPKIVYDGDDIYVRRGASSHRLQGRQRDDFVTDRQAGR